MEKGVPQRSRVGRMTSLNGGNENEKNHQLVIGTHGSRWYYEYGGICGGNPAEGSTLPRLRNRHHAADSND